MAITCITLVLSRSTITNVKITVLLVSLALAARLRKCKRFFVRVRQKGVVFPGVPSGDSGNWE